MGGKRDNKLSLFPPVILWSIGLRVTCYDPVTRMNFLFPVGDTCFGIYLQPCSKPFLYN